jgi:CBS domain-containing protein
VYLVDKNEEKEVEHALARDVMTPCVYLLDSDSSFREIIAVMSKKVISAVFIKDKKSKQFYIITQTDIVNFLNNPKQEELKIKEVIAADLMHGPVDMIDETTPIDIVIRYMAETKRKRMLIGKSKSNEPTGVISLRDILMWNNLYFRTAKPIVLIFIDNQTGILIGKHIFSENTEGVLDKDLIDLYSGAIKAISHMSDEVMHQQGNLQRLVEDNHAVLFEPYKEITGVLICDGNSIELHQRLHDSTHQFYNKYHDKFCMNNIKEELDISDIVRSFKITPSTLIQKGKSKDKK